MFYLIGGPPRCGKTSLSKLLGKNLRLPWLSADTLEAIMWEATPEVERPQKFPKGMIRAATEDSNDVMYSRFSPEIIMQAYREQAKTTWSAIDIMIKSELKDQHSYIIEGHHIHPELVQNLQQKYGPSKIRSIFLGKQDIQGIIDGGKANKAPNNWFLHKTELAETFNKMAEMIRLYSFFFEQECQKNNQQFLFMDGDFEQSLLHAQEKILNK